MALDRTRLKALLQAERARFADEHPISRARFEEARGSLLGGVPMTWMAKWAGGHPVFAARAGDAWIEDVDGHRLRRLRARRHRRDGRPLAGAGRGGGRAPPGELGGATMMLPTEDAAWVGRGARRAASACARWSSR